MTNELERRDGRIAVLEGELAETKDRLAKTEEERATYGRTFVEPAATSNYIQFGEGGHGEFEWGFELLEKIYPRYVEITTVYK